MNIDDEYKYNFKLNNKTLLFARVAFDAINKGEYENAFSLLENGIEQFDEYPTPFFLMGDLLLKMGKIEESEIAFKKGNAILNNEGTFNYYLNLKPESKDNLATDGEPDPVANKDNTLEDLEELEELEGKLKTAKIEINHENHSKSDDTILKEPEEEFKPLKGLVSETLASIYMNQSNYKEAKAIYRTLIDIHPEREEYFMTKISAINLKMAPRKSEDD